MNRYKLMKAGINANEGSARVGGNLEVYERILNKFPADEHYSKMKEAILRNDVEEAYQNAHALKGTAGNLSINELYKAMVPLVEELKAKRIDNLDQMLEIVSINYQKACDAIVNRYEKGALQRSRGMTQMEYTYSEHYLSEENINKVQ